MDKLSLPNFIRFSLSGIVLYLYMYFTDSQTLDAILKPLGIIGIPLAIFTIPIFLYIVYRPIYDYLIIRLQDSLRFGSPNCRKYLIEQAKKEKSIELDTNNAQKVYQVLRDRYLTTLFKESLMTWAASIHLCYLSAILSIPFIIFNFFNEKYLVASILVAILFIFFLVGFLLDRQFEENEFLLVRNALTDEKAKNDFYNFIEAYRKTS